MIFIEKKHLEMQMFKHMRLPFSFLVVFVCMFLYVFAVWCTLLMHSQYIDHTDFFSRVVFSAVWRTFSSRSD